MHFFVFFLQSIYIGHLKPCYLPYFLKYRADRIVKCGRILEHRKKEKESYHLIRPQFKDKASSEHCCFIYCKKSQLQLNKYAMLIACIFPLCVCGMGNISNAHACILLTKPVYCWITSCMSWLPVPQSMGCSYCKEGVNLSWLYW